MAKQMTPGQRRKANALIRKTCCNYDYGNCIALDDGEECVKGCAAQAGQKQFFSVKEFQKAFTGRVPSVKF